MVAFMLLILAKLGSILFKCGKLHDNQPTNVSAREGHLTPGMRKARLFSGYGAHSCIGKTVGKVLLTTSNRGQVASRAKSSQTELLLNVSLQVVDMPINPLEQIFYIIPSVTSHSLKGNCETTEKQEKSPFISYCAPSPREHQTSCINKMYPL